MRRLLYSALLIVGILMVFPLLWMASSSFKSSGEIFSYPPQLIPEVFRMDNYQDLLQGTSTMNAPRWLLNSTFVALCRLILSLFFCSLAGFGFAKYEFRGRSLLFSILLGSMMIPFYTMLIPVYALMINLGWTDTYFALIVPFVVSAFGVFLMRQYMVGIPDELMDAARMDGASDFRIYWQVFLPLCKPALAALAIMGFRGSWNSYLWPMIVLTDPKRFTMPMGIVGLTGSIGDERAWGTLMAACTLSVFPLLVMYILMQRQFISGLALGSVKR